MVKLSHKRCLPCEGIGKAYTIEEVRSQLKEVPGWGLGQDQKSIERSFTLKDFIACVDLINRIKDLAEEEQHHPDLHLTGYKNLKVVLYTHALGGVSENDMILAAKINEIA